MAYKSLSKRKIGMKKYFVVLLSILLLLSGCGTGVRKETEPDVLTEASQSDVISAVPETQTEPEPEPIVRHLMAAGDVMSHMPMVEDAYVAETDSYDYTHMMAEPAEQLRLADYAIANLETVLGGGPDYSGYPNFNSPDALAHACKDAGFDLLSTANNHTRDQGMDAIFRTLDVLDEIGLAHVGTYRSAAERDANNGIYVADIGGISVAFLCYTYGLNGYRLPDDMTYAVNLFNIDYDTNLIDFDYDRVDRDLAAARALDADLTAVIIHWGVEYDETPTAYQREIAEHLFQNGVDLIFGGHPHVLQPYETVTFTDDQGVEKQGFVIYSFGNFISNQQYDPETKTTVILDLELTKDPVSGTTAVTDVCYMPYYMLHRNDLPVGSRRQLVNIHKSIEAYENGTTELVTYDLYQRMQAALTYCHEILGPEGDRAE